MERIIVVGVIPEAIQDLNENELTGKRDVVGDSIMERATAQVMIALTDNWVISPEDYPLRIKFRSDDKMNSSSTKIPVNVITVYGEDVEPHEESYTMTLSNINRNN